MAPTTSTVSPSRGRERVEGGDRGDRRERRGPCVREVQAARLRCDVVLRDGDQLRPAPVVHGRVRVEDEAEDLVADPVAADAGADLLDDAGEVAAEGDGELVLDHLLQRTRRDEHVDGVDGGGVHAHEQLVVAGVGLRDVVSQGGLGVEAVEGERSHGRCFLGRRISHPPTWLWRRGLGRHEPQLAALVAEAVANGERLGNRRQQSLERVRVEVGAPLGLHRGDDLVDRERKAVDAVADERVEDVGDGDDPPGERDRVTRETAWIAAAVEPLVVRPGDLGAELEQRLAASRQGWCGRAPCGSRRRGARRR